MLLLFLSYFEIDFPRQTVIWTLWVPRPIIYGKEVLLSMALLQDVEDKAFIL